MRELNWPFVAALLAPLTVMIAVYCFGLSQESHVDRDKDERD